MAFCIPVVSVVSVFYVKTINFIFSFLPITGNALTFVSLIMTSLIVFVLIKIFGKPYGVFQGAAYVILYLHIAFYILAFLCGI